MGYKVSELEFSDDHVVVITPFGDRVDIPISTLIKNLSDVTMGGVMTGDVTGKVSHIYDGTPVNAVVATLTTDLTGDNNDLVFTAKTLGAIGNSVSIKYIDPGAASQSLSVAVVNTYDIEVSLATDGDSLITTTAGDIHTAIEANQDANALVEIANKADNNGTGVVTAMTHTHLASGVDGTEATKGALYMDADYFYVASANNTTSGQNWRRISLGSAY